MYTHRKMNTHTYIHTYLRRFVKMPHLCCVAFACKQSTHTVTATYEIFRVAQTDDRSLVCLLCAVHEGCICMQIDSASRNRLIRLRIEIIYAHAPVRLVF